MHRLVASDIGNEGLDEVRRTLEAGGVVCFPTDTLYGIAVDPSNEDALDRIYTLKHRSEAKPVLLLVNSIRMAQSVCRPDSAFLRVASALWPGSITLINWAAPKLSPKVTAGTGTVGLRWPDHRLTMDIVRTFGRPVTATSANVSGKPPARSAEEVINQLGSEIDLLIDGDPIPSSEPSTILDLTSQPPTLLRKGPVTLATIQVSLNTAIEDLPHES